MSLCIPFWFDCEIRLGDYWANTYNYKELMGDTLKPFYKKLVSVKYSLETVFLTDRWKLPKRVRKNFLKNRLRSTRSIHCFISDWTIFFLDQ